MEDADEKSYNEMKKNLSLALAFVCAALLVWLILMKSAANAQHETDAGAIADFSNKLDTAQSQLVLYEGRILVFSNRFNESQSAMLTFSNHLVEAGSTLSLNAEQITNLNRQVAAMKLEYQNLGQQFLDSTNQLTSLAAGLTKRVAQTEANLGQANSNYVLLENRLRRDVAERLVIQRKFFNILELQSQLQRLKDDPFRQQISASSIFAGLDVEVQSNALHVIAPN